MGGGCTAHFVEPTPPLPRSESASLPSATEPATSHGQSRRHPAPLLGQNSMVVKGTGWRKQAPPNCIQFNTPFTKLKNN